MHTKLTLSIDKDVIKRAKEFAKDRKKSLSKLVEDYLIGISGPLSPIPEGDLPPITKTLAGLLKDQKEIDMRNEFIDYLEKKYT